MKEQTKTRRRRRRWLVESQSNKFGGAACLLLPCLRLASRLFGSFLGPNQRLRAFTGVQDIRTSRSLDREQEPLRKGKKKKRMRRVREIYGEDIGRNKLPIRLPPSPGLGRCFQPDLLYLSVSDPSSSASYIEGDSSATVAIQRLGVKESREEGRERERESEVMRRSVR